MASEHSAAPVGSEVPTSRSGSETSSAMAGLFEFWAEKLRDQQKNSRRRSSNDELSYLETLPDDLEARATILNASVDHWRKLRLWSNNLAPELVGHDELHAQSVERLAVQLLRKCWDPTSKEGLAPIHLHWLSVAAWLHDWGHVGGVIEEWDQKPKCKRHYFTSPFEVRAVHGLLSQEWLGDPWKDLHKLDSDICIPAGLLCAHHQRWTDFGDGKLSEGETSNPYDDTSERPHGERVLKDKDIEILPLRTAWEHILAKRSVWQSVAEHSQPDNFSPNFRQAPHSARSTEFEKFCVLLLILRIADAADYGQHRAPVDVNSRKQLWVSYIHRQALTHSGFPEDESDTLLNRLKRPGSGEQRALANLFDELSARLEGPTHEPQEVVRFLEHMKNYVGLIAKQEGYYIKHQAVVDQGVQLETEMIDGSIRLVARVQPSASTATRESNNEAVDAVRESIEAEWATAYARHTGLSESVKQILNLDVERTVAVPAAVPADESRPEERKQSSVWFPADREEERTLDPGGADFDKTGGDGGQFVGDDRPVRDTAAGGRGAWWLSKNGRTHVLGWVAAVFDDLGEKSIQSTTLGGRIRREADLLDPELWVMRPHAGKKRLGEYLESLRAGITEVRSPNGHPSIEWPNYKQWLSVQISDFARQSVGDDCSVRDSTAGVVRDWWLSEDNRGHVLGWVAAVFNDEGVESIKTSTVGVVIRKKVKERFGNELDMEEFWKRRPWSKPGVRLGQYLEKMSGYQISEWMDNSKNPPVAWIKWPTYKQWLGAEVSDAADRPVGDDRPVLDSAARAARAWWYSPEGESLVPRWVASGVAALDLRDDDDISTQKLGLSIQVEAELFAHERKMDQIWKMRPWGPGKPPMVAYLESLKVGIEPGTRAKTIKWHDYEQWLVEDQSLDDGRGSDLDTSGGDDSNTEEDDSTDGNEKEERRRWFGGLRGNSL